MYHLSWNWNWTLYAVPYVFNRKDWHYIRTMKYLFNSQIDSLLQLNLWLNHLGFVALHIFKTLAIYHKHNRYFTQGTHQFYTKWKTKFISLFRRFIAIFRADRFIVSLLFGWLVVVGVSDRTQKPHNWWYIRIHHFKFQALHSNR